MYSLNIEAIAVVKNICIYYMFFQEYRKCLHTHFQQQVQLTGKLTCYLSCNRHWNFLGDVEISRSLGQALIFPGGFDSKESSCSAEDWARFLGQEDPLEKGMATHSGILAGRIPWTEEPGGLQSMGMQRVGHD